MELILAIKNEETDFNEFESKVEFDLDNNIIINVTKDELKEGIFNIKDEILNELNTISDLFDIEDNENVI